jgi:hypothetical protein
MARRRVRRVRRVVFWFLEAMVHSPGVQIREGGEQLPQTFFEMVHLGSAVHLHRSEKVSETCYPPSLFGNNLPCLVQQGADRGR